LKTSQLAPIDVEICLLQSEKVLTENGLKVEYLSLVDAKLMEPTTVIDDDCHLIIAARLGTTRLIDNLRVLDSN
jgi:pantothenate synthetase